MKKRNLFLLIVSVALLLACDVQSLIPGQKNPVAIFSGATDTPAPPPPPAAATATTAPVAPPQPNQPPQAPANTPANAPAPLPAIIVRKILYSLCDKLCDQPEHASVWISNADGGGAVKVVDHALAPSFSPDGLKFAFEDAQEGLYTVNVDGGGKFKLTNDPGPSVPDWNHSGKLIAYVSHQRCPVGGSNPIYGQRKKLLAPGKAPTFVDCTSDITIIAPDGTGRRVLTTGDHPTWSPDDAQIAYDKCEGSKCGIWVIPAVGGTPRMVTDDVGSVPHWSPNGRQILYHTDVDGIKQLMVVNVDGTGKKQVLASKFLHVSGAWSLNGGAIYYRSPELGSWDIMVMNADGTNPRKLLGGVPPVDWANEKLSLAK